MLSARLKKKLRDFELDVTLSVHPGEVLVLLGENGSGKSTILNLLAGLLEPDQGSITLNGKPIFSEKEPDLIPPEERNIGYVFQNYALFPHMTTYENVAFGLKMRKMSRDQISTLVDRMLADLGMSQFRDEKVTNLSGGQRQRVALARALVIQPDLLLLDEPLTALDRQSKEKIRVELREELVKSNKPAILVTHSLKDARIIGDHVIILAEGKVIWTGKPDDLQSDSMVPDQTNRNYQALEYINFSSIAID